MSKIIINGKKCLIIALISKVTSKWEVSGTRFFVNYPESFQYSIPDAKQIVSIDVDIPYFETSMLQSKEYRKLDVKVHVGNIIFHKRSNSTTVETSHELVNLMTKVKEKKVNLVKTKESDINLEKMEFDFDKEQALGAEEDLERWEERTSG